VKQLIFSLLAVAVTATTGVAQAQSPAPTKGHRVGLIDMAHVFQHYKKFEELRSGLQAEIEKSDAEAKVMVERLQKMQAEIKKFDAGSTEYEQREKQLLDLKGEFDAFRAATQRRLARRESETFKVIYTDVTKAVKLYAEYAHFDHVMRFNRKGIEEITNPQEAVQTMNKTFIYTNSENDITDVVLQYLNKPYATGAPAPKTPGTSALPAGRTRQQ
jgi:outer membrane protein